MAEPEVQVAEEEVEVTVEAEQGDTPVQQSLDLKDSEQPEVSVEETSDADELDSYSKGVQKRIKKLTEKYRYAERDKEEAARLADVLKKENEQLKTKLSNLDQGQLSEYGTRSDSQLATAKHAYKEAHDRGDVDAMFDAQQALSKISIEQERFRLAKQRQEQEDPAQAPVQAQAEAASPATKPDPKAEKWAEKNEWFGEDEIMTQAAFVVHNKLIQEEGFDPESDEYYSEIDRRMRTEFPHKFDKQKTSSGVQVASANSTASRNTQQKRRSVKLSPSQIAIAKKLGVPLEEYAKYVKD